MGLFILDKGSNGRPYLGAERSGEWKPLNRISSPRQEEALESGFPRKQHNGKRNRCDVCSVFDQQLNEIGRRSETESASAAFFHARFVSCLAISREKAIEGLRQVRRLWAWFLANRDVWERREPLALSGSGARESDQLQLP